MRLARLVLLGALLGSAGLARAQVLETEAHPVFRAPTWELAAGVRTAFISDRGYDPFSTNDALVGFALSGTRLVVSDGRLSLAAGLGLDLGGSSASARGVPSTLSLTRISAVAEGRYQPWQRFYFFGRLAPGLLHGSATLDDHSSPNASALGDGFDVFSVDAAAGGAFCLGALGSARVGAWLVADGGYGWAPSHHLILAPSLNGDQSKAGTLDLGSVAPRGGFFRIALALGY